MAEYITRPNTGVVRGSKLGIPPDIDELLKDKADTEDVQKLSTDINAKISSTNTNVSTLSKSLGETQTKVTEHSERLVPLEEKVPVLDNLSERTESLEITTQAHTDSINDLNSTTQLHGESIETLNVTVARLQEGGTGGGDGGGEGGETPTYPNVPDLSQPLQALTVRVDEMEPEIDSQSEQISSLQSSVQTLEGIAERTESLESKTQTNTESITELNAVSHSNSQSIQSLTGTVAEIQEVLGEETPDIDIPPDLTQPLNELTGTVNQMKESVNEIKSEVPTHRQQIISLQTSAENLEDRVSRHDEDVPALQEFVSGVQTKMDSYDSDIPTLKTDVSGIKTKVTGYDKDIPTLKTDSGTLKTDVASLKSDMGTTKSRLNTLENNDMIGFKMKPYEVRKQGAAWDLRDDYVHGGGTIEVYEDGKRLRLTFAQPFTTRPIGLVSQDYSGVSAQFDIKIGNCQLGYADITFYNKSNVQVNIADMGTPLYFGVMFVGV